MLYFENAFCHLQTDWFENVMQFQVFYKHLSGSYLCEGFLIKSTWWTQESCHFSQSYGSSINDVRFLAYFWPNYLSTYVKEIYSVNQCAWTKKTGPWKGNSWGIFPSWKLEGILKCGNNIFCTSWKNKHFLFYAQECGAKIEPAMPFWKSNFK